MLKSIDMVSSPSAPPSPTPTATLRSLLGELLHHFVQKSDVPLSLCCFGHPHNVSSLAMHFDDAASMLEPSEV